MMKTEALRIFGAALFLCLGMLLPRAASAENRRIVPDVELSGGGILQGQVCTSTGQPLAGSRIKLLQFGNSVASVISDEHGKFRFSEVRGGVHGLQYEGRISPVRIWLAGSAPVGAVREVALATDPVAIRGQSPGVGSCNSGQAVPMSGHCGYIVGGQSTGCISNMAPCGSVACDPCTTSPPPAACAAGGFALLDAITLTAVGASVAALAISVDNRRTLKGAVLSSGNTQPLGFASTSDSSVASP